MNDKELLVNNHDARCIDWYRRLIADSIAQDGQRIAVQMYDEAKRLQSENDQLKAERDKAVYDINCYPNCHICSKLIGCQHRRIEPDDYDGCAGFNWRGLEAHNENS